MNEARKTIVVVEDEESVLSVTVRLLDRAGYDVLAFSHPHAAREYFRNAVRPPALLMTDVMMPGMSGLELCRCARQEHPALPVIFTSGYPLDSLPGEVSDLPEVSCLISKPFGLDSLRRGIEDLLAGRLPERPSMVEMDEPVARGRRVV